MARIKTPAISVLSYELDQALAYFAAKVRAKHDLAAGTYDFVIKKDPRDSSKDAWIVITHNGKEWGAPAGEFVAGKDPAKWAEVFGDSNNFRLYYNANPRMGWKYFPPRSGSLVTFWATTAGAHPPKILLPTNDYPGCFLVHREQRQGPSVIVTTWNGRAIALPFAEYYLDDRNKIIPLNSP